MEQIDEEVRSIPCIWRRSQWLLLCPNFPISKDQAIHEKIERLKIDIWGRGASGARVLSQGLYCPLSTANNCQQDYVSYSALGNSWMN